MRTQTARRLGLTPPAWTAVMVVVAAALLELAPRVGLVDPFSVVPLSTMVSRLLELLVDQAFWADALAPSLSAITLAFLAAVGSGILTGVLLWEVRPARTVIEPWLTVYYAIPTFALYPLVVAVMGVGLAPIVLLGTLFAVVAVVTATLTGLDAAPATVLRLARSLQMSPWQRTVKILVPAALPHIFTGARLALSYALIGVLASEFVLSTSGLGHFISRAYNNFAFADMYAGVLLVLVMAAGVNVVLGLLARRGTEVAA